MSDAVLDKFSHNIREVQDRVAGIYLFGSRARGTAKRDSDYDLLLVVRNSFTLADKESLYDAVVEVLLETGHLVSLKIFAEDEFARLKQLKTPFMTNVERDAIKLG